MNKYDKKLFIISIVSVLIISLVFPVLAEGIKKEEIIKDIPTQKWAREPIEMLIEKGLLQPVDGMINPNGYLTRAEIAYLIDNSVELTEKADLSKYKDIDESHVHYESIQKAVARDILQSEDGLTIIPNGPMSRQEFFVAVSSLYKVEPYYGGENLAEKFKDNKDLDNWAREETNDLIKIGYIKGNQDNMLLPKKNITRAEAASLLSQIPQIQEMENKVIIVK